ncbi:MAG: J domain-containing protein [Desulfobacterales bacterium]|nr:J domain-containing protein [Desulfobacterales bacterium]
MTTALSTTEIFDACSLLFGSQINISLDFVKYLQPSGVKAAYWQKALETHPDRAKYLGKDAAEMGECFKKITAAYKMLSSIVTTGNTILYTPPNIPKQAAPKNEKSRPRTYKKYQKQSEQFYQGNIPARKLLFGQYIYYSGFVSWRIMIKAIIWQRKQRPLIGKLACEWGMLSDDSIQNILRNKQFLEKFGECAIRKGYLSSYALMALLGKQRRLQKPMGHYLVKNGILLPNTVLRLVKQQQLHNRNYKT